MKTIIAATNYSRSANSAVKYAAALARQTNAELILFNAFEFSVHASNTLLPASAVDELVASNKRRLKRIGFRISDIFRIKVKCVTSTSEFKEELDFQAGRLGADLVVIGVSKSSPEYLFHNTASHIARHSKFPVLVVPEGARFEGISKILFAYDPSCVYESHKLGLLKEIAASFNAQVQVCHVENKELSIAADGNYAGYTSSTTIKFDALLHEVKHSYKDIIEKDIIKGIEQGAENFKADLLAMVPHKYGFWEGILHKSKTGRIVRRTHIPLLTLPNAAMDKSFLPYDETNVQGIPETGLTMYYHCEQEDIREWDTSAASLQKM